jgi:hypothetical protein
VKGVFSPLDWTLKLHRHSWTPETIAQALKMGVEIPSYGRAAERFQELTKIALSRSSLERLVDEYGGQLVEFQAQEAEAMVKAPARGAEMEVVWRKIAEPDSAVMSVSLDGTTIRVRNEEGQVEWKEVKVATISAVAVEVQQERDEEKEVHLSKHSYRAGLWEAKEFAKQQWAEACRRGLEKAKKVVAVNDGALWIWLIIAMCYAPCIEIIDWWHAVEKIWGAANSLLGPGEQRTADLVERQKYLLWAGRLRAVLHEIRQLCPRGQPIAAEVWATVRYIYNNRRRMDYARYRQEGYPVGSGSTESACKLVVQERMKQAGMCWSRHGAQAVLALRSVLLSGRWNEIWPPLKPVLKPA